MVLNFLKKIVNYTGYKIINIKNSERYNLENTFIHLIRKIDKGQKFIIFDVGGHAGTFTQFFIKLLNQNNIKNYEIHFFEPNSKFLEQAKKKLSNNKVIFNEFGLGAKNETKEFYIHESDDCCSSFLKLHDNYFINKEKRKIEKVDKKIFSVDEYVKQKNIKYIDIIKLDTQGFNEEVIAGATKSLENQIIKLIYSEIILGKTYEKSENFYNFEKYLIQNNYSLFGIDIGTYKIQVVSKFFNKELNIDVFYANNKFYD